jgi:hypothetical protein
MRIAQVAPLTEAVPPTLYGGTERVVQIRCRAQSKAVRTSILWFDLRHWIVVKRQIPADVCAEAKMRYDEVERAAH